MDAIDYLNQLVYVEIDRPVGSMHPKRGFVYSFNYGFVPNVISGDGEELDVYVFGVTEARKTFTGRCIAVIHRIDEDDDKLVVVPDGAKYTDDEIIKITYPQERFHRSIILR